MAFVGITFDGQNVSPKDDGALYQAHYGDGIIDGCAMTLSGDDLVIQSGHIIACGRQCKVDGATTVDLSTRTLSTGYIQVILNYDLSQAEGNQWYESFVESATTTFPALTTGNINGTDTLYQLELAVIQISGGNLTAITSSVRPSHLITSPYIWINSDSSIGVNPSMRVYYDDVFMGQIYSVAGTDIRFANGQGTGKGLYLEPNYVDLWADGQPIILRPNGGFNTTNQIEFTASGQQLGGHPKTSLMTATAITCAADKDTDVQTASGLDSNGIYLVTAGLSFAPSASTGTQFRFALTSANDTYTQSVYTASTATHMMNVSGIFNNTTWVTLRAHPFSGAVSCSATYRKMCVVRLA